MKHNTVGRAGASPPSRTTGSNYIYTHVSMLYYFNANARATGKRKAGRLIAKSKVVNYSVLAHLVITSNSFSVPQASTDYLCN